MTKHQADELDYRYRRDYDIEHLSDDEYCAKHQPSGVLIPWGVFVIGCVVLAVIAFII